MNAANTHLRSLHWILPALVLLCTACGRLLSLQQPVETKSTLQCGENHIEMLTYTSDADSHYLFVNVHEDEQTSIEALRHFALEHRINYLYLHHAGTRRIQFALNGKSYSIDPNRMFTDTGRKKTLEDGENWSEEAQSALKTFSEAVLDPLKSSRIIVALHNNTPDRYSIQSYMPDSSEAQNTAALYINPDMDPDDFIYTTDEAFFRYFKAHHINVILQDNTHFVDDGSLSVYCGFHNLPYVNIETEHGHLDAQISLLELLLAFEATP